MYIGWAQKQDFALCTLSGIMNEIKFNTITEDNPIEDQDPPEGLQMTKLKSNKKK